MHMEFHFGKMKKFWIWIVVMLALNCTLKMVKMVDFMLCVFNYQSLREVVSIK